MITGWKVELKVYFYQNTKRKYLKYDDWSEHRKRHDDSKGEAGITGWYLEMNSVLTTFCDYFMRGGGQGRKRERELTQAKEREAKE